MLDKERVLHDLTILRDKDKKLAKEARTQKERDVRAGSQITLDCIIHSIKEGNYDKC